MAEISKVRVRQALAVTSLIIMLVPALAFAKPTVYLCVPENNIDSYSQLMTDFQSYVGAQGDYGFQPFRARDNFEQMGASQADGVYIISSWHYQALREEMKAQLGFETLGLAQKSGKTKQHRVLTSTKTIQELLKKGAVKITSSASTTYVMHLLGEMLATNGSELVGRVQVVSVPSDIDALRAVSFGLADAAVVTDQSLTKLKDSQPKQHGMLKELAKSKAAYLPVIAVQKGASKKVKALGAVLLNMSKSAAGKKLLRNLGVDGFQELSKQEKKRVEKPWSSGGSQSGTQANDILRRVDETLARNTDIFLVYDVTTIDHKGGQRSFGFEVRLKGAGWRRLDFLYPGDLKGMRILIRSAEQFYVYLPSFPKVRRVATHAKKQGFMGTAIGHHDMEQIKYRGIYSPSVISEDNSKWTLELKRNPGQKTPYRKLVMDVRKSDASILGIRSYDDNGTHVKTEKRINVKCRQHKCSPEKMVWIDHSRNDLTTTLTLKKWNPNPTIPDSMFTVRSLMRRR